MIKYEILSEVREQKGVSWKYLEDSIKAYRGKFTEFKNSKTSLTIDEENTIADALGVSRDYLCGLTEQKNKPAANSDELQRKLKPLYELTKDFSDEERADLIKYAEFLALKHKQSNQK
jgi:transcriptional regulator with XRE-family HTH domain